MSKTSIERILELHNEALDGKLGEEIQIIAEQGVIATNNTIAKLLDLHARETKSLDSLQLSLEHKRQRVELAQMEVDMCQLMIDTLKATNAALQAAQQCGTSSTDSSSKNSPAEGKESESSADHSSASHQQSKE